MQINYIAVLKLPNETPLIKMGANFLLKKKTLIAKCSMEHICHKLSISSHHRFHIEKPQKIGVYLPIDRNRFQSGQPPKIRFY